MHYGIISLIHHHLKAILDFDVHIDMFATFEQSS